MPLVHRRLASAALVWFVVCLPALAAEPALPAGFLDRLVARPLGPANMGGRITALAVVEGHPATQYVAAASGGLWKTTNAGTTWTAVFEQQSTVALGDVALAPSDPEIVWVGTGEANARNSVSWGDGVYKSTDGGKTWKNMGLGRTRHIGRIVIHPTDPDIVYVAALGHVWMKNPERGLFKTTDGGRTWSQVLALDDETGAIDLVMSPSEPDTLYAAAYRVRRDAFSGGNPEIMLGPRAGLYKSTDAGKTWRKLTRGLPTGLYGRCGLALSRKDPRILLAVVQTDRTDVRNIPGQPARENNQPETGGIFRSTDAGETWIKLNDLCPRPFYFGQIRIDPNDDRRIYVLGVDLHISSDGGRTFRGNAAREIHADLHALWIDPADSNHLLVGTDGGVYVSHDRSTSWEHLNNLPLGQFYAIGVDRRQPFRVFGGLQDNGSWGGPSRTTNREGISNADWFKIFGADGFYCQPDPDDFDTVYAEGQYGMLRRINLRTGAEVDIRPRPLQGAPAYRFNWSSPILLSPHDSRMVYYGGNQLFRSTDRGATWEKASPDLTRGQPGVGPNTAHTLTTLAESSLEKGVLYVGSDDGLVHVSRDGGKEWVDIGANLPGIPAQRWITRVEASPHSKGTAYLSLTRYRNGDDAPYVFKTTDYGRTWKPLMANLPANGPVHVIKTDPRHPGLLYVGTEFGLFVTLNDGAVWQPVGKLPTVPVHDLLVHPRDRELVIATHGRSIYLLDVTALQELTPKALGGTPFLCDIKPVLAFRFQDGRGLISGRNYLAPNPEPGAALWYVLPETLPAPATVTISDGSGRQLARLTGSASAGVHKVQWNLRASGGSGRGTTLLVPPGEYSARLEAGGQVLTKRFRVEGAQDPVEEE
jgi:photosystem II stability/assembly factor-like uncharacterized protein